MGANDDREMLEVAKEECVRLELELEVAKVNAEVAWGTARKALSERDAALAVIERVKSARSDHPQCDVHDNDDPISCGWKRAVLDIDRALAPESPPKPSVAHPAPSTHTTKETGSDDDS